MSTIESFDYSTQGWQLLNSEADLLSHYPAPLEGYNRLQPYRAPDKYPCLFKEIAEIERRSGPDQAVLAYIYDYN